MTFFFKVLLVLLLHACGFAFATSTYSYLPVGAIVYRNDVCDGVDFVVIRVFLMARLTYQKTNNTKKKKKQQVDTENRGLSFIGATSNVGSRNGFRICASALVSFFFFLFLL